VQLARASVAGFGCHTLSRWARVTRYGTGCVMTNQTKKIKGVFDSAQFMINMTLSQTFEIT